MHIFSGMHCNMTMSRLITDCECISISAEIMKAVKGCNRKLYFYMDSAITIQELILGVADWVSITIEFAN